MRIRSVHAHLLSCPLPTPLNLTYHGGRRTIVKRDAMLIRVEADNGLIGYAPGQGSEAAKQGIDRVVAPFLAGRTLADPDALRVQFLEGSGRSVEHLNLYCAVEIALYDLVGKSKNLPVSELLGGRVRDGIRLYGSAGMYMTPAQYAEEASAIAKLGFRAYKMRAGIGPEQDLETVRQMREAVGPDFELMVDAHTWWRMGDRDYTPGIIEKLAEEMSQHGVAWLEERRARARRACLFGSDSYRVRRLCANGRGLPRRVRNGAPPVAGNRARRPEVCLSQLGHRARSNRGRAPGSVLAAAGDRVVGISLLCDSIAGGNVSVSIGCGDIEGAAET
jgi:hypothetical protein